MRGLRLRQMKHLAEFIALIIIFMPFALLPRLLALKAGEALGVACFYMLGARRRRTIGNIDNVQQHGVLKDQRPPDVIARECFRNLGRTLVDIARTSFGLDRDLVENVRIEGIEHVDSALSKGRGYIAVTGHFSNWELLGIVSGPRLKISTSVARRQSNPYIDRLIIRNRERMGMNIIYKEGAVRQFMKDLKHGKGIGLVIDEPMNPAKGIPVNFLGYKTGFVKTLHALSKRYGAPVVTIVMYYDGSGGYVFKISPEIVMTGEEVADTQKIASYFESYISEHPTEWLQWYRKWTWARHGRADGAAQVNHSKGTGHAG